MFVSKKNENARRKRQVQLFITKNRGLNGLEEKRMELIVYEISKFYPFDI